MRQSLQQVSQVVGLLVVGLLVVGLLVGGWIAVCVPASAWAVDDVAVAGDADPYPAAPFPGNATLDTAATGEWWKVARRPYPPNREFMNLEVPREQTVGFALYTVDKGVMKMTAQLYPLFPDETRIVRLELKEADGVTGDASWTEVAQATIQYPGWCASFRLEGWDDSKSVEYRVRHGEQAQFTGLIRQSPKDKEVITVGVLSCNSNKDRGDRAQMVANLKHHDPDLLFFAGDQSYDHKEHTAAWLSFGKQFADVLRDRPVVTIPDDHDIGQGNLWGEGGIKATNPDGNSGGYFYPAEYVMMVERCQTSHLPDAFDPTKIARGIGVYYTSLNVGGVDFAIIEDRKFKSGPGGKIPQQGPRPDHILNPDYDPASIDVPGLELLGARQLDFLRQWGQDWTGAEMKCVLSQTVWTGVAQVHGNKTNRLHADLDNNGWPQAGRNRALRELRRCWASHLCGDQHLASVVKYGIDDFRDGGWSFCSPAIVNNYYSRWWLPEADGERKFADVNLPWTGDYLDGMGNKMTMRAFANPDSQDNGSGYGLAKFDKASRKITFECWPRYADVTAEGVKQFAGWPVTLKDQDNDGRKPVGHLPTMRWKMAGEVVVQVIDEATDEILYTVRPAGTEFRPAVFSNSRFTVRAMTDSGWSRHWMGQRAVSSDKDTPDSGDGGIDVVVGE
jgi:hypothetical protein